ncbi:MAG: hypothetical protein LIP00_04685 [Parabacteroides sp.]|nr:hypothetical protein [Parabacteroides sp.]
MNKTYTLFLLRMICLAFFGCLPFMACDNGEDIDTNPYKGGIGLNVYGPSPVARGGILRFLGSGMNQVTAVVIPGCGEITEIEVISDTEIRVTVPQTAEPGFVVLKTPGGDITTRTELNFLEPVSIEVFAPAEIKPGSELSITGEYLNLIKEVIFAGEAVVSAGDFVSHTRKEIKILVPDSARTGKFILSDGAELPNWIYSDEELRVILPSVTTLPEQAEKKPGDRISVAGRNLDLVRKVRIPNKNEVEFELNTSGEQQTLSFVLPADMTSGTVVMVPGSGVEVPIAEIAMALPEKVTADPATGLRADDRITLQGINMELVTNITFPGVEEPVTPDSQSATEIGIKMPAAAVSSNLLLNTGSGETVGVTIETAKPENLSYSAPGVAAGENVTIKGNNLDLVSSVVFSGEVEVPVSGAIATELVVKVPTTAQTGLPTLKMANGETVEAPSLIIEKPVCAYLPDVPAKLIRGKVVRLEIANADKLQSVQLGGIAVQFICDTSDNRLSLNIPVSLVGNCTLKLISSNGEISYEMVVADEETTIWEGSFTIANWNGFDTLAWGGYDWSQVEAGQTVIIYYDLDQSSDYWQMRVAKGDGWGALTGTPDPFDLTGTSSLSVQLNTEQLNELMFNSGGLLLTGHGCTLTKITLK